LLILIDLTAKQERRIIKNIKKLQEWW